MINEDHVRMLGIATSDELRTIRTLALGAAQKLYDLLLRAQLALVDLKFEVGKVSQQIILADEISADTCRLRDLRTGEVLDKDVFRQNLAELLPAYREVLRRLEALPALQSLSFDERTASCEARSSDEV
jgi:phosphoribosylaminoimidazole-succinocarboxamide synthase